MVLSPHRNVEIKFYNHLPQWQDIQLCKPNQLFQIQIEVYLCQRAMLTI